MNMRFISVFLLGLVLLTGISFAAIFGVNSTAGTCIQIENATQNHTSIQLAINNASAGDTIYVCANGTTGYSENIVVNQSINLYGNESGVKIVAADPNLAAVSINASRVNMTYFTINGSTAEEIYGLEINSTATYTHLYNLTVQNSSQLLYIQGNYSVIEYSNFSNCSSYGVVIGTNDDGTEGHYINFTNNIISDSSDSYGIEVHSDNNNILSNTVSSTSGVHVNDAAAGNNFSSNTISSCSAGFEVSSQNNVYYYNSILNSETGIVMGGNNETFISNNITNATYGILSINGNGTFTSNRIVDCSYGIYLIQSTIQSAFTYNTIFNSTYGLYSGPFDNEGTFYNGSTVTTFSGNNITNSTTYMIWLNQSNLTFSGNNGLYSTPAGAKDVYLENASSLNTSTYNITSNYLSVNVPYAQNLSLQIINFSGVSGLTTVTTITGVSITSGKAVKFASEADYYGVNVTNTSSGATLSLKLFYNNTDVGSAYSSDYLGIGQTTSGTTWTYLTPTTRNTTAYSLYYTPITSFTSGYFIPLVYLPTTSSSSSGDSTSKKTFSISYTFDCKTGAVKADAGASGASVQLMGISTAYSNTKTSDSDGEASFTITKDGTYKIFATKDDYVSSSLSLGTLTLCPGAAAPPAEEPDEEPEAVPDEEPAVVPDETDDEAHLGALLAIASVQDSINSAKDEGKLTAKAQAKLDEAQEAYDAGNYELAEELAAEAVTLITEPKAPSSDDEADNETPAVQEPAKPPADYSWVLYAVIVLAILAVGYFFLRGSKKGYKGFKMR